MLGGHCTHVAWEAGAWLLLAPVLEADLECCVTDSSPQPTAPLRKVGAAPLWVLDSSAVVQWRQRAGARMLLEGRQKTELLQSPKHWHSPKAMTTSQSSCLFCCWFARGRTTFYHLTCNKNPKSDGLGWQEPQNTEVRQTTGKILPGIPL